MVLTMLKGASPGSGMRPCLCCDIVASHPLRLSLGGFWSLARAQPRVARLCLAGKVLVLHRALAASTLGFLVGEDDGLLGFVAGVVTPVGLHEHGVDLLQIDDFGAVAHGFDERARNHSPPNFPEIVLPFPGRKRRLRLEKMACNLTKPTPGNSAMRPKNRVWGGSRNDRNLPLENRLRCPELRRKSGPTPTFFTPGIPQWPSRDPIEEEGGLNLYGFVGNSGVGTFDRFGLEACKGYITFEEAMQAATADAQIKARKIIETGVQEMNGWKKDGGVGKIIKSAHDNNGFALYTGKDFAAGANTPDVLTITVGREVSAYIYCYTEESGGKKFAYAKLFEGGPPTVKNNDGDATPYMEAGIPMAIKMAVTVLNLGSDVDKELREKTGATEDVKKALGELICPKHKDPIIQGFTHTHTFKMFTGKGSSIGEFNPAIYYPLSDPDKENAKILTVWAIDHLDKIHKSE